MCSFVCVQAHMCVTLCICGNFIGIFSFLLRSQEKSKQASRHAHNILSTLIVSYTQSSVVLPSFKFTWNWFSCWKTVNCTTLEPFETLTHTAHKCTQLQLAWFVFHFAQHLCWIVKQLDWKFLWDVKIVLPFFEIVCWMRWISVCVSSIHSQYLIYSHGSNVLT